MHSDFPRGAHDFAVQTFHRYHPNPQPVPVVERLHGHVVTQAPKVVCKTCNNVWMSGLETPAKRWLEPMMRGERVVLDLSAQRALLHWIVLKLMVIEQREGAKSAFTRRDALRFKADRSVPSNLSIDLFHTTDERLRSFLHRESGAIPPDSHPAVGRVSTNLQAVLFSVGQLLIHARHAQLENIGFKQFPTDIATPLWPDPVGPVAWPPPIALNFDDVEHLKGMLGRYLSTMTPV